MATGWEEIFSRRVAALLREIATPEKIWRKAPGEGPAGVESLALPPETESLAGFPLDGKLGVVHPLSGESRFLDAGGLGNLQSLITQMEGEIGGGPENPRLKAFQLWRYLPEELARLDPSLEFMPADIRNPDHTVFHDLDMAAAHEAAGRNGHGTGLLTFHLGPVQSFIAEARTLRDLWTGSAILSWLSFKAMAPILEELGPTAIIYPSLRGTALMDLFLEGEAFSGAGRSTCYPNRFLALVPWGEEGALAHSLSKRVREGAMKAWECLAEKVRLELGEKLKKWEGWDRLWDAQVKACMETRVFTLPTAQMSDEALKKHLKILDLAQAFPGVAGARNLAGKNSTIGRWMMQQDFLQKLSEAYRSVRHVPPYSPAGPVPGKCAMTGTWEQMGPAEFKESTEFWDDARKLLKGIKGVSLRKGERLSAIGLIKRFAAPVWLAQEVGIRFEDLRFQDTATVAAKLWLEKAEMDPLAIRKKHGDWSGQWLHGEKGNEKEDGPPEAVRETIRAAKGKLKDPPPAYYAVVVADGDEMGKWLRGEKSPCISKVLHEKVREYFEKIGKSSEMTPPRPLTPALQAAMSEALNHFSTKILPSLAHRFSAELVYSGGDDVLALVPLESLIPFVQNLRGAFKGLEGLNNGAPSGYYRLEDRNLLTMGPTSGLSAGVAVVHHKEDLREALERARKMEKQAKKTGRDRVGISVFSRSGEMASFTCAYEELDFLKTLQKAFQEGASDGWVYRLCREWEVFSGLDSGVFESEIKRQVERTTEETRKGLGAGEVEAAAEALLCGFKKHLATGGSPWTRGAEEFLSMCQTASFLARGRNDR